MVGKVFSCSFIGLECKIIEVQADISNGLPSFSIVGLGDVSVQESKERVRASIRNSGEKFPQTRKTINLAPAQIKKQGTLFDLPIAISILLADDQIPYDKIQNSIIIGELSLTGKIKRINGALLITQYAKEQGFKKIFLPSDNSLEASFIDDIKIYPLNTLKGFIEFCRGTKEILKQEPLKIFNKKPKDPLTISNIIGLEKAKRGFLIGAAGFHNILLNGSPGCGKTLLCRAFQSLLPEMNKQETLEITKIFSIAGLLNNSEPLIEKRQFREVHHTASLAAVIGGGTYPKPGEISLAHNGVLFLDEIAEFSKHILEALRQPLEDKFININRINASLKFPSNFILLATMNPCPCGYKNDKNIRCICTETQIKNYQKSLSGPILDRFDLFIEVSRIQMDKIFTEENNQNTEHFLAVDKINKAIEIQKNRFKNETSKRNSEMTLNEIKKYANPEKSAMELLNEASQKLNLSNRGYIKTIKIARTIADIEESENILANHIAEAIQYRKIDTFR